MPQTVISPKHTYLRLVIEPVEGVEGNLHRWRPEMYLLGAYRPVEKWHAVASAVAAHDAALRWLLAQPDYQPARDPIDRLLAAIGSPMTAA